jgi:hypothetical protein
MLASELNQPVDLTVETVPFLPLLLFNPGDAALSEEIKEELLTIKDIHRQDENIFVSVEAYPEKSGKTGISLAKKRSEFVAGFLARECRIPDNRISTTISSRRVRQPAIRITVGNKLPTTMKNK